ncbi:MAG TPA: DUF998 domain-containing protein [Ktedonobacterales bacterium]|nr:DUF998 domain-containing protein [Ktedonobacterales bacterium]
MSPLTLGLVSCGGVGALLFTVAYVIEGFSRPGYNWLQQPISALSLGPGGWVQQVNFVVFGILLVLSAVGWRRVLTPGRASLGFPLLQGLIGLCLIVVGVFSQDPLPGYPPGAVPTAPTVHGTIHADVAYVLFVALAVGCFVLARRFTVEPYWGRRWARYSVITGVIILLLFVLFIATIGTELPSGLYERESALAHALWSCLIVAALFIKGQSAAHKARKP